MTYLKKTPMLLILAALMTGGLSAHTEGTRPIRDSAMHKRLNASNGQSYGVEAKSIQRGPAIESDRRAGLFVDRHSSRSEGHTPKSTSRSPAKENTQRVGFFDDHAT